MRFYPLFVLGNIIPREVYILLLQLPWNFFKLKLIKKGWREKEEVYAVQLATVLLLHDSAPTPPTALFQLRASLFLS